MDAQLRNHNITISHMRVLQGNNMKYTNEYLNKCIYIVGMGSNDYLNNYLLPKYYPSSRLYTPDQYAANLIRQYSHQLTVSFCFCLCFFPLSLSLFSLSLVYICVHQLNPFIIFFIKKLFPPFNT